ncbi:beta strand repeat-containing protein [Saccharospirillum salsuginis]|nr:putative Ig domain-containing protein [Saccharospirillum salsuginis]
MPTTVDTVGEAVDVFDFTLSDGGGGDGLPMSISQIVLNVSGTTNNTIHDQITWRLNGPDASNVIGTYNAGTITFSGLTLSIADSGNETYTVNAYYNDNTGLIEGQTFILSVDGDTDVTTGGSGTSMGSTSAVTNGSGSTVEVTATTLAFTTQPASSTSGSALGTQPVVTAQDDDGNTDVDFTETITLSEASAGSLSGDVDIEAVSGVATFTDVAYTATADQESFTLTANDEDGAGTNLPTEDSNSVTSDVVATKLVFNTQPVPTTIDSGVSTDFTTDPVVQALDANNTLDTGYSTNIVLLATDPNDGIVDGTVNSMTGTGDADGDDTTVTLTPSSGAATFSSLALQYTNSGASDSIALRASSGGLMAANSSTITSLVNNAPVITNLDSDSVAWAGIGNTVTLDSGGDATASDTELDALNGANGDYSGGSLTVQREGGAVTSELFGFDTSGALFSVNGSNLEDGGQVFATFTNTNGVLTISFTSSGTAATTALVSDLMQRITYRNDTPAGDATVRFTLSDGSKTDTADVTVTTDSIYITDTTDTATIDPTDGTSFSEAIAIAIAAADGTGSQTLIMGSSLAAQTVSATSVTSLAENLTLDMDSASGATLSGGTLTLGGGVTLTLTNGNSDTASINTVFAGTGSLTKTGDGTVTLSGSHTYSGTTTLTGGTVSVAGDSNLGSGQLVMNGGTLVVTSSGTIDNTVNLAADSTISNADDLTLSGLFSGAANLSKAGAGQMNLTNSNNEAGSSGGITITEGKFYISDDDFLPSGTITLNGGSFLASGSSGQSDTVDNNFVVGAAGGTFHIYGGGGNYTLYVTGVISGSGDLEKITTAALVLSGTNTYSGNFTISTGNVSITDGSNLGSGTVTLNGGTLTVTGSDVTITNELVASSGNLSNANNVTWSGVISGSGGLTKNGAGTLTLSGTQTHSGTTNITAGDVSITDDTNIGSGTITLNGGGLTVTGTGTIDNAISIGAGNGTATNANAATLSGVISGTGSLTKAGAGTLTISATNTNTGTLTLSAGKTVVTGSVSGPVSVGNTATLESTDTVSGLVTVASGGTLQTGASPGTLTLAGGLTLDSGGTLVARVNGTTAGTTYDQYDVTGTVTLGGTLNVIGSYTGTGGESYTIINNDSSDAVSSTFNGLAEGDDSTTLNSIPLAVSYVGSTGNDVVLSTAGPDVTDGNISISGATGTGGTYKIGDTVTATWDDTSATGDNNGDISGVTVDFTDFGGGAAVVASNSSDTWTATYTLVSGAIDGTNLNVSVAVTDANSLTTTTTDSTNASVDNTQPSINGVTSSTANGTYKVGDAISIQVTFNEVMTVTGTPQLTLETGSTDRVVDYASGSGTDTLTFTYTVQEGDASADLDYTGTSALALNGGTINDDAGNAATLMLATPGAANSLGDNKALVVDGVLPTVTEVTSSSANGNYKAGDAVSIQVNFSEAVTVTGTPQLTLETGGTDQVVDYTSGSGTSSLTFTYTVQVGDTSADLDYLNTTALALNGGTIADAAGNAATLTLASPGAANSLGANKALMIDTTTPTISGVNSSTADGSYKVGDSISIQVNVSEAVTVTGTPQLTLETGDTDQVVDYDSGSGTSTLSFTYTVQAGDSSADLDYTGTTALALNGGTIADAAGNDATLTLASAGAANSLGANKSLVVDGVEPTVTAVTSSTTDGSYKAGDAISIQVNFSEAVTVTGTPQLTLETGDTDQVVDYASGSGTTSLTFTYTVQAGDTNTDLDYLNTTALALNGGTIADAASNAATLTLASPGAANSLGDNKALVVDGVVPTVTGVTSSTANGSYNAGDSISIQVNFSEAVTVTGTPQLTLETGDTDQVVDYASGSGSSALTFTYTVQAGDTSADLDYTSTTALALNSGTIMDGANNAATLTLASPGTANSLGANKAIVIDTTAPSGQSVAFDDATINAAEASSQSFTFSGAEVGTTYDYTISSSGGGTDVTGSGTINDVGEQLTGLDISGLGDGTLTLSVTLTDGAGNAATAVTDTATLDTAAPNGQSVAFDDSTINGSEAASVSFTFSGAEVGAGYSYTISSSGGGTDVTGTGTIATAGDQISNVDISGLSDGTLTLSATLTDTAGNAATAVTDTATLDATAPTGQSVAFDDTLINSSEAAGTSFTFSSAEVGASYTYSISSSGGGTDVTGSGTLTTATDQISNVDVSGLSDGTLTLSVTLSDSAGNEAAAVTDTTSLDTTAPSLTEVSVTTLTNDNTPAIQFSTTEAGTLAVDGSCGSGDEGAVGSGSQTITLTDTDNSSAMNDAAYSDCTLIVTDAAGNASNTLSLTTFTVDTTAPGLGTNTGVSLTEGGTEVINNTELAANDSNSGAANITFTLTAVPTNGTLSNNDSDLAVSDTFTQDDIDNDLFSYAHNGGDTTSDSFSFTLSDSLGNTSVAQTVSLNVTAVNDEPTLTATGQNPTFTEGGSAVALFSSAAIDTIESGQTLSGLVIEVSSVANGSDEVLGIDGSDIELTNGTSGTTTDNSLSYNVSVSGSVATVTLSGGTLSEANAQTLVDGLTYVNNSEAPNDANRVVTLTSLTDSGGTANGGDDTVSLSVSSTVTTVAVNDVPVLSDLGASSESTLTIAGASSSTASDSTIGQTFTATANGTITEVGFVFTTGGASATLNVYEGAGTSTAPVATKAFTTTQTYTDASNYSYQTVTLDTPVAITQGSIYTVAMVIGTDENTIYISSSVYADGNMYFADISRSTFDLLSEITTTADAAFTEGGSAIQFNSTGVVADAELDAANSGNGNYSGASLTIARNGGASANDSFGFSDGNGISLSGGDLVKNSLTIASFENNTGTLTITFTDANGEIPTSEDVDAVLQQLLYSNSSEDPASSAQLDWSFSDGTDSGTGSTTIGLTAVNDAPSISGTPATTVAEDSAYSFTPTASDLESDPLTFSITNKPTWATFSTSTGALTGTPANDDVGTDSTIVISVSDGSASTDLASFDITVTNTNDAPTISGTPSTTVAEDSAYSFTPTSADVDVGDTLTFSITNKPSWASFNTNTGALTGTPANGDVGTTSNILISVSDGTVSVDLATFNLTVTNTNDAPTISGSPATSVNEDSAYSFTPTANDVDLDASLTFSIANKPSWATFSTSTGALTGTPANDDVGDYSDIVISVSDGTASTDLASFDITVTNTNDAPTISGTPATTVAEDVAYSFTPTADDVDLGDTLTFSITNQPSWASFDTATGTLSGTPTNSDLGTTSGIVISVGDGTTSASLAAFDLTVTNVNDAPTISGTPATTVAEDSDYSFTPTAADVDPGNTLTFSITNMPNWASFDTNTGALTGTPTNDHVGSYDGVVISVSDGTASSSLTAFDIEVTNTNDAPVISGTPDTVGVVGVPYSFVPTASDVDVGDTLTFSIASLPGWASFDTATGELSGTAAPGDEGDYSIEISVSDGTDSTALGSFTLTVAPSVDTDGDGVIDYQEGLDGTDPNDPTDYRDTVAPVVTAPDELTIDAVALYTPVPRKQLLGLSSDATGTQVENALAALASDNIDGENCCNANAQNLINNQALLPPGRNEITWQATDAKGNVGTATQIVNVRPLVSLSKDQVSVEGATARIKVVLNGESPAYPLDVPFVIDSQSTADEDDHDLITDRVTFNGGEIERIIEVQLTDDAIPENEEVLIVRLDDRTTNAQDLQDGYDPANPDIYDINAGAKTVHRLRIVETNVAPDTRLSLTQGGKNTIQVTTDGGPVTVTATVTDPNPDESHSYNWSDSDTALVDTDGDTADNTLVFDPSGLSAGRYKVGITVTDSESATDQTKLHFRVVTALPTLNTGDDSDNDGIDDATEGTADNDDDGIPDYLDNIVATNVLPEVASETDSYLVECDPGVRCRLGQFALVGSTGGARLTDDDIAEQADIGPDTVFDHSGGIFDFEIHDLPTLGQSVRIVVPQSNPLPEGGVYRKFQDGDWRTFVEDANNELHSAPGNPGYCPPPGDESWEAGLQNGYYCVQLTIEDGGPNDADGLVNGAVVDPGAVGIPKATTPTDPTVSFNSGGQSKGGTVGWLLSLLTVLLVVSTRHGKRN